MNFQFKTLCLSALALLLANQTALASSWTLPDSGFPLSGGSYSVSFDSAYSGSASLSFDLRGHLTLDGANNGYTDTFILSVNGTDIFSGQYAMGGGGENITLLAPTSSNVDTTLTYPNEVNSAGGEVLIDTWISLIDGRNTIRFDYGDLQGLSDEGWGVSNIEVISSVPVPAALWLFGSAVFVWSGLRKTRV